MGDEAIAVACQSKYQCEAGEDYSMTRSDRGESVLITGGARRDGGALCRALAADGGVVSR